MRRISSILAFLLLLLPVIHAELIKVHIDAYNAASLSGDAAEASVQYMQYQKTHYKCRLLAGDTAVMSLTNLPKGRLDSMVLYMHSNASSGAGSLYASMGKRMLWSIPASSFNSPEWAGAFSSSYVPVSHAVNRDLADINIQIVATENSLYWEQLYLYYTPSAPQAYTVYLYAPDMRVHQPLVEDAPGAGVELPKLLSVSSSWEHIGWTDTLVSTTSTLPLYYPIGMRYYPTSDTRLYALYRTRYDVPVVAQTTAAASGEYVIAAVSSWTEAATPAWLASGEVVSKRVDMAPVDIRRNANGTYELHAPSVASTDRYQITFSADSLTIITAAGDGVGHTLASKPYLNQSQSAWQWQMAANNSFCIYTRPDADGGAYMLMPAVGIGAEAGTCYLECQHFALNLLEEYLLLFEVSTLPETVPELRYSSLTQTDCSAAYSASEIDLTQECTLYTIDGRLIMSGHLSECGLPHGVWIVRQGTKTCRMMR